MKLSELLPNVPDEIESGLRFTLATEYGMIVIRVDELRERAAYDSANERFMWLLKQTHVLMLKTFGEEQYQIDGPRAIVTELMTRSRLAREGNNGW